jgi:hypothetical protein
MLSSHLCPGPPSHFIPSGIHTGILYEFLISPMCATCPAYIHHFTLISLKYLVKSTNKVLKMQFSPASCYCFGFTYSPQHHVLGHPQSVLLP